LSDQFNILDQPAGGVTAADATDAEVAAAIAAALAAGPFAPTTTGATAATRYRGGTATAAPTTGTFLAGDWVTILTGGFALCTVAGTPGTWVVLQSGAFVPYPAGGLGKIGYVTNDVTQSTISTVVDVTSLSLTFTAVASRRYKLSVGLTYNLPGSSRCLAHIKEGATIIGRVIDANTSGIRRELGIMTVAPAAGSHTYKVTMETLSGTVSIIPDSVVSLNFFLIEDIGEA